MVNNLTTEFNEMFITTFFLFQDGFWVRFLPTFISGLIMTAIVSPIIAVILAKRKEKQLEEKKNREIAEAKKRIYEEVYKAAVETYAYKLGRMIKKANGSSKQHLEVQGRAIVATRNELRATLVNLSGALNSEIDELESEISRLKQEPENELYLSQVSKTISVLAEKWDIKEDRIKNDIRKLLTELGYERFKVD